MKIVNVDDVLKILHKYGKFLFVTDHPKYREMQDEIANLPSVNQQGWIPIKTRPLTDEEKEEYADLGYGEDSMNFMYDCPLPDDREEVLITTQYDEVIIDTFYRDDGCYFETYFDDDDVKAWMPLPEPYKAESEDKE